MSTSFHITTFGCQMNRHDSDVLAGDLVRRGFVPAADQRDADLIVFNTCAVRAHAEDRLYSRLGALRRLCDHNPSLRIGVIGCVAQKDGLGLLKRFPHVAFVLGTQHLARLGDIAEQILRRPHPAPPTSCVDMPPETLPLPIPSRRAVLRNPWSAQVAVMRGCNNFCSYCIVPHVQGREVSRPVRDVLADVRELAAGGVTEITLLGQNVDSYGRGLDGDSDLASLIARVARIPGLRRLFFITSHPRDLSPRLAETVSGCLDVVCPYFHVPPQSGSNRILRLMNRGYTRERYIEMTSMIRETVPGAVLAGDFIVGFPSETAADFDDTIDLLERVRLSSSFIFKYSPRPFTRASAMPDDVASADKIRRHRLLSDLQHAVSLQENRKLLGRTLEVLVQGPSSTDPDRLTGRTRGNRIVIMPSNTGRPGDYVRVAVADATPLALYAEGVSPAAGPAVTAP